MAGIADQHEDEDDTVANEPVIEVAYIPYDGPPVLVTIPKDNHLEALNRLVGGHIEGIYPTDAVTFFGYDEARIFGQPVNQLATSMCDVTYGYNIVGDVVACCSDSEGATTSIVPSLIPGLLSETALPWRTVVHLRDVDRAG